jgi:hypothetical protein
MPVAAISPRNDSGGGHKRARPTLSARGAAIRSFWHSVRECAASPPPRGAATGLSLRGRQRGAIGTASIVGLAHWHRSSTMTGARSPKSKFCVDHHQRRTPRPKRSNGKSGLDEFSRRPRRLARPCSVSSMRETVVTRHEASALTRNHKRPEPLASVGRGHPRKSNPMRCVKTITTTAALVLALSNYALAQGSLDAGSTGGAVGSSKGAVNSTLGTVDRVPSAVNRVPSAVNAAPSAVDSARGAVGSGNGFTTPLFRRLEPRQRNLER